jgi:endo-1,4-beta-xylanase
MQAFVDLAVEVVQAEPDIRITLPPNATTESQRKLEYYNMIKACVHKEKCVGTTLWDFDDTSGYSWVPGTFAGWGYATPFFQPNGANALLVRKCAYDGIIEALQGQRQMSPK